MSGTLTEQTNEIHQNENITHVEVSRKSKKLSQNTTYDRLSLGIDIGTSHCEVIAYGKNYDPQDEEGYHYTGEPLSIRCTSSLILFAKDNESSINFVNRFQKNHKLYPQEEYLQGKKIPYVFHDQVEELLKRKNVTADELDILKRSTITLYPVKNKTDNSPYNEFESAVIRLNVERALNLYVGMGQPLDIALAKPCEAGSQYDLILHEVTARIANRNESHDNRCIIRSEAVFTGHYLLNMLEGAHGALAVCDIGAGTGDVYIFDQDDSATKVMHSFDFAGNQATRELMHQLKKNCNADISERDANKLKEQYGYISGFNSPETVKPVLIELYIQGKPRKIRAGKSLDAAARPIAQDAVNTIVELFKKYDGLSPRHIALTGYQGQMPGLDKAIEEGLHLQGYQVTVRNLESFGENDPRSIVAKGAEHYSRSIKNENWTVL